MDRTKTNSFCKKDRLICIAEKVPFHFLSYFNLQIFTFSISKSIPFYIVRLPKPFGSSFLKGFCAERKKKKIIVMALFNNKKHEITNLDY